MHHFEGRHDDVEAPGDDFPSGRVPGRVSWNMSLRIRVFGSRRIYRRKGDIGGQVGPLAIARRGPTLGRAQVWRRAHLAPLGAPFWLAAASDVLRSPE